MKLIIPITGTVLVEGSISDGKLAGDPKDPIRQIDLDLGNVSWKLVEVDLETEEMLIEVSPAEELSEDTGEVDGEGDHIYKRRKATEQEKQGFLQHARNLVEEKTKDELYVISKSSRLKRPFKLEVG